MLKKIGVDAVVSSSVPDIAGADKLILPGVGGFDAGMDSINRIGIISALNDKVVARKTPILGICLGMQLFTRASEEGHFQGLGWIDARTLKFRFDDSCGNIKVPHMGWNSVSPRKSSALLDGMGEDARFYFVHSYHVVCGDDRDVLTTTHYGQDFVSAFEKGNIIGTQFHPEKSHKFGMRLLKNFIDGF